MAIIIKPPKEFSLDKYSIFLAGSIEQGKAEDWQSKIEKAFADKDVIILNPRRDAWDSSWKQDIHNEKFKEQVVWELKGQEEVDCIVIYFDPDTTSPISLLELGLFGDKNKTIVCCPDGFFRKGNVDIVCERYSIPEVDTLDKLIQELIKRVSSNGALSMNGKKAMQETKIKASGLTGWKDIEINFIGYGANHQKYYEIYLDGHFMGQYPEGKALDGALQKFGIKKNLVPGLKEAYGIKKDVVIPKNTIVKKEGIPIKMKQAATAETTMENEKMLKLKELLKKKVRKIREMAKLSARGRTELFRAFKQEQTPNDNYKEWKKTFIVLMSDGKILEKYQVKFKPTTYDKKGILHDWGWKVKGKIKQGVESEKYRDLLKNHGWTIEGSTLKADESAKPLKEAQGAYSFDNVKRDKEGFYNKIEMMGHRWAKETVDEIERICNKYGNTQFQKYIIYNAFDFNVQGEDWNYFSRMSKKFLAQVQFILKNSSSMNPFNLLVWLNNHSGVLKTELDWALEWASYKRNKKEYTRYYIQTFGFYGMRPDEAVKRLENYIAKIVAKDVVHPEWV